MPDASWRTAPESGGQPGRSKVRLAEGRSGPRASEGRGRIGDLGGAEFTERRGGGGTPVAALEGAPRRTPEGGARTSRSRPSVRPL